MTGSSFTHSGISELDLTPGQFVYVTSTCTTQPLFVAPTPRADCRTCGAPDQPVGGRCRYCVHVVAG